MKTLPRQEVVRRISTKRMIETTTMVIKIPEISQKRGKRAQDLLMQTVEERSVDITLVSEPYCKPETGEWYLDISSKAVILVKNGRLTSERVKEDCKGFI